MTISFNGTNGFTFNDGSTQSTAATGFGFKNRIINGAMAISQRGTSFTLVSGATQYTLDRWYANTTGGAGVVAQTGSVGSYALQMTGAAGVTSAFFGQKIESNNIADLAGQTVTVSVTLSSSTLTSITWYARYPNAQDNYSSVTVISNATLTINSTPTQYTFNISLPSNVVNGLEIFFLTGAFTSGTLTVKNFQLEKGSTATSFDYRPYGTELQLCQRYYEKSFAIGTAPANNIGSGTGESLLSVNTTVGNSYPSTVPFKVIKRTTATVTLYNRQNASNDWAWYIAAGTATNGGVVDSSSDNGFVCRYQSVTTFTVVAGHWTASAEL